MPESRIVAVEDAGPEVVIYNDESSRAGSTVTAAAQNFVYKNDYDSGYGLFLNYFPSTGLIFPFGTMVADEVILGNGFDPVTDVLTGYEILIFRSSKDPTDGLTLATYHVELWDGDPLNMVDTTGDGFKGTPIATATFSGVPGPILAVLHADIPKTTVNHQRLWVVLYAEDTCRTAWRISSKVPQIGDIFRDTMDVAQFQTDYDGKWNGLGHCCDLPFDRPCDLITDPCHGDPLTSSFCTDLDAESAGLFFFGGLCTGGLDDFCASFVTNVFSQTDFTVTLQPRMSDGDHEIVGNEIMMPNGGQHVWLDIMFQNWSSMAPPGFNTSVKTWTAKLDPSGYYSGIRGTLTPWNPPCTSDADCEAPMQSASSRCNDPAYIPGGCSPGFQDWSLDPACPQGMDPVHSCLMLDLPAASVATLAFVYGSTLLFGVPATDDGLPHYGGTLVLEASPDAKGTFTIPFDAANTWMKNTSNQKLPMIGHVPALVTIVTGQCCFGLGAGKDNGCVDGLTVNQCANTGLCKGFCEADRAVRCATQAECDEAGAGTCIGGATLGAVCIPGDKPDGKNLECDATRREVCTVQGGWIFNVGRTCEDRCCTCTEDSACDDGDACTVDVCDCDCQVEPRDCDDGFTCTIDDCDPNAPGPWPQNGCFYTPLDCDDGLGCTADTCEEPAGCAHTEIDCSDNDPCSVDRCVEPDGTCSNVKISDCCESDDHCPPGKKCVNNVCVKNVIPTVSQWGLAAMTLLLLAGAKVLFGRRRARTHSGTEHYTL